MDRNFVQRKLLKILLIFTLVLQQCSGQQNFNLYDDYDDQGYYDSQNPGNTPPYNGASQRNGFDIYGRQIDHQSRGYLFNSDEEQNLTGLHRETKTYQPHPEQSPQPSLDPDTILVPRLGLVRGQHNFKTIKNRPVSAYLGLKYATVKPGLGRFQVI